MSDSVYRQEFEVGYRRHLRYSFFSGLQAGLQHGVLHSARRDDYIYRYV